MGPKHLQFRFDDILVTGHLIVAIILLRERSELLRETGFIGATTLKLLKTSLISGFSSSILELELRCGLPLDPRGPEWLPPFERECFEFEERVLGRLATPERAERPGFSSFINYMYLKTSQNFLT